jgi:phosphoribosylglycinamide formyltransferase-1
MKKIRLALFASGTGSNALNIIDHFAGHRQIEVGFVLTNKADAPVVEKTQLRGVETIILNNDLVSQAEILLTVCREHEVDYIILAGYLRLVPSEFIEHYDERIINIHPSLLPKFGGKGMYGSRVHEAVLAGGEMESGISIHYVDSEFDEGRVIAQFSCEVDSNDTIETLSVKISQLEHAYFPKVIEETVLSEQHD